MDGNDVMARLTNVFRNVFGNESVSLSRATTARDVDGWDSLMHINLIVAIEREFKMRFTTREIAGLQNVGELMDVLTRKSSADL
jgi:acyl carrier protein